MFTDLYRYRGFILSSVLNEKKTRFGRSALGGFWMVLHPLAEVLLYAVVLSNVLSARLQGVQGSYAFAIYLTAGILAWSLFAEIIARCCMVFIDNANLVKKVALPKVTLPIIVVGSGLVNNLFLLLAILLVFAALGHSPTSALAWLPLLIILTAALAAGMGVVLGVLNIFVRDVAQFLPVLLQFLFWLTPIVYPVSIIPEAVKPWISVNPLVYLVTSYQNVLLHGRPPEALSLLILAVWIVALMAMAFSLMSKSNSEMVDHL